MYKIDPITKILFREVFGIFGTCVLPAYRKDTGRAPEGHRKGTELPLRYSRNASGTLPLSSGNMSCRLISWHIGGHFQKVVLVGCLPRPLTTSHGQACPRHWLVRAHSKDSVWKKYQKTRIPEGYRKGTGRAPEG